MRYRGRSQPPSARIHPSVPGIGTEYLDLWTLGSRSRRDHCVGRHLKERNVELIPQAVKPEILILNAATEIARILTNSNILRLLNECRRVIIKTYNCQERGFRLSEGLQVAASKQSQFFHSYRQDRTLFPISAACLLSLQGRGLRRGSASQPARDSARPPVP